MSLSDLFDSIKWKSSKKVGQLGITISKSEIVLAHTCLENADNQLKYCERFTYSDPHTLEALLQKTIHDLKLQNTLCNVVLSPGDYQLLLIDAPSVEPEEMSSAVKWRIKELIEFPLEEAVISTFGLPDDAYRNKPKMIYVAVTRKTKVLEIVDLIQASGLVLNAIDIPELSMKNLSMLYSNDEHGLAFIELLESGSTLNMCKNGAIYLTRHLNTPVAHDVMDSPDWESIKDRLILEIQRSLDFYESQIGQRQISKLIIAPRLLDSTALVQELNESMTVQVKTMDLSETLNYSKPLPMPLQQASMIAIGGALRQDQGLL